MLWAATCVCSASRKRSRDESSTVPEPKSRSAGRPDTRRAAYVTTSTGLVTMTCTASGATSTSRGRIERTMPIVDPARSSRDWPGFCFAPAVKTTTSESARTSMSSEPSTWAIGTNWMPWLRSSASARTFAALTSKSATVWAAPRIRVA